LARLLALRAAEVVDKAGHRHSITSEAELVIIATGVGAL